jgi:ABC-type Co2+ transport system permease subunit
VALARQTERKRSLEQRGSTTLGASTVSASVVIAVVSFLVRETSLMEAKYPALGATLCFAVAALFAVLVITDGPAALFSNAAVDEEADIMATNNDRSRKLTWASLFEVLALVLLAITAWLVVF